MENTLQIKDPSLLKNIFDLKGSLVDRNVKGQTTPATTLKDQNFIRCLDSHSSNNETPFVNLRSIDKRMLLVAIRKDVEFLRD
jgi:hypothetical protein